VRWPIPTLLVLVVAALSGCGLLASLAPFPDEVTRDAGPSVPPSDGGGPPPSDGGLDPLVDGGDLDDDGGAPAAGGAGCALLGEMFVDDFSGGAGTDLWGTQVLFGGGALTQTGGRLEATFSGAGSLGAWVTRHAGDLRGSALSVFVQPPTAADARRTAHLEAVFDTDNYISWGFDGDYLIAHVHVDGVAETNAGSLLTPTPMWLRIREADGTIYFERSTDGTSWQGTQTADTPWFASLTQVKLSAGTDDASEAEPAAVYFDDLNILPGPAPGAGAWCAAESLDLSFPEANLVPELFDLVPGSPCSVTSGGGLISLVLPSPQPNVSCELAARQRFDLVAGELVLGVEDSGLDTGVFGGLRMGLPNGNSVSIAIDGSGGLRVENDGLSVFSANGLSASHVRLREEEGTVYFESSEDRVVWTTHGGRAVSVGSESVSFSLFIKSTITSGDPQTAIFTDVNP
jgi:hypothetical protein